MTLHRNHERMTAGGVASWLYRVTTNRCWNVLRNRENRARLLETYASTAPSTGSQVDGWNEARAMLASVPADVAAVAVHHHMDGMTYDEIAEVLGCSRRHVGTLLARFEAAARTRRTA